MSKMSKIVETALDKKHREYVDDASKANEHMQERSLEEDEPYEIPKMIYHTKVESKDLFGCQMVIFNENEDTERLAIYLHGGIYVNEIKLPHISFCDKLAKRSTQPYLLQSIRLLQTIPMRKPMKLLKIYTGIC